MTKPLFDVFREAKMRKPTASHKEACDWFIAKMQADPAYLELLAREYFERMSVNWTATKVKHGFAFGRTAAAESTIQRRSATRIMTAEEMREARQKFLKKNKKRVDEIRSMFRNTVLLDLTLPNGKALRHATSADCAKAGGFYAEIAKHIKPTQVVDRHLTENDLKGIQARFFLRNIKDAAA